MHKISVAICDDLKYICKYYKSILSKIDEFEFLWMAHNTQDAINLVEKNPPDILLLDIQVETSDAGIIAIPEILKTNPSTKIIVLTIHKEDEFLFKSFANGASDYIIKTCSEEELLRTIKKVYDNQNNLKPEVAQKILRECYNIQQQNTSILLLLDIMVKLSTSELEIIKDLYNGLNAKQISKKRVVEEVTVRSQISSILKKLKFSSTKELKKFLVSTKILDLFK